MLPNGTVIESLNGDGRRYKEDGVWYFSDGPFKHTKATLCEDYLIVNYPSRVSQEEANALPIGSIVTWMYVQCHKTAEGWMMEDELCYGGKLQLPSYKILFLPDPISWRDC